MPAAMSWKRKISGGVLGVIGFMLSPLSWWNDAFVNLPLALVFAWLVIWSCPLNIRERAFQISLVVGYWLTNVLGFLLVHIGARKMFAEGEQTYTRRELARGLAISLAYTALILILIKLGVLKPFEGYFPRA